MVSYLDLKNTALAYLMLLETDETKMACVKQYENSGNMTDALASLHGILASRFEAEKASMLQKFYQRWQSETLVINLWFAVQAMCPLPGTFEQVKGLMNHQDFDIKNPNKVRALIGTFSNNAINFHQPDGTGYEFLTDQIILLDCLNPQIASRLLGPLIKWRRYRSANGDLMRLQLERIMKEPDLSADVYEIVSKSLTI